MRGVRCPVLVGRGEELGMLTDLLGDAVEGRGGAAFLLGEAGIGKSRLLTAVADIARSRDMAVLRGRAAPSQAPVPYRPLAEAFLSASRGREIDLGDLERFRSALAVLLPGYVVGEADQDPSIVLLGEATLALAERFGGAAGTLLVLEDLHAADAETCELIDYLSDKLGSTSIALVGSARTGEPSPAERLAHDLTARRHAESVLLPRLAAPDVAGVIEGSLGTGSVPESLLATVGDASGGVPLLVEELLASLIDAGALVREGDRWQVTDRLPSLVPPSFAALVDGRIRGLGGPAQRALDAAAVLGEQIDHGLVAAMTGLDEATTIEALREAGRAQLVDETREGPATRFRFHHGLGRSAVLDRIPEPDRRRMAAAALQALDGAAGDAPGGRPLELMANLALSAGDSTRAVRLLIDAAHAAIGQGACTSACRGADLAVELAPSVEERARARAVLLDACVASGDAASSIEIGRELLADLERSGADPVRRARTHLRLAEAAIAATDADRADRHLDQAEVLVVEAPADLRAGIELARASTELCRHRPHEAIVHAERAMHAATEKGDDVALAEAGALLGRARRVTDVEAAKRAFVEALEVGHRTGRSHLVARLTHELATIDVLEAGPPTAMEEARRLAEAAGALALVAVCDVHLAIIHWLHFELDRSRVCAERARAAAARFHLGLLEPAAATIAGMTGAALGHREEVVASFERYLPMTDSEIEATARGHGLATLALTMEDRGGAIEQLRAAAALVPAHSDVARAPHCGMRALLLTLAGDDCADVVVDELRQDRAVVGVPRALVGLAAAVRYGRVGDRAAAETEAGDAFTALRATPWFLAMGRRLAAEAAIDDGWGRPEEWLRQAYDFFDAAGIRAPAAACRQLLRRTGAPAPRAAAEGQHPELARLGVTPRETEVMALVAAGRSNREIAGELVLSVRTVEKHLERLMVKTACGNRTQLAALAARLGVAAPAAT